MRRFAFSFAVFLLISFHLQGISKAAIYYNDGGIHDINYVISEDVSVSGNTTVNLLYGGFVSFIGLNEYGVLNINGGGFGNLALLGNSATTISEGVNFGNIHISENSVATIIGGSEFTNFHVEQNASLFLMGGSNIHNIHTQGEAKIFITGGANIYGINTMDNGTTHVKGSNFNFPYGAITNSSGILTGVLASGEEINCSFNVSGGGSIVIEPASETPPQPPVPGDQATIVSIPATSNFRLNTPVNTGLVLNQGDLLTINTDFNDTWRLGGYFSGYGDALCNANGLSPGNPHGGVFDFYTFDSATFRYGSLIGKIGNGDYFFVGTEFSQIVQDSGTLFLASWDSEHIGDNSDSITVNIIPDATTPSSNCQYYDSDEDGVIDEWDSCPNTPSDSYVNLNGCELTNYYVQEQVDHLLFQKDQTIAQLQTDLSAFTQTISLLQTDLETANQTIAQYETSISLLNEQIAEKDISISSLQSELGAAIQTITELDALNEQKDQKISELNAVITAVDREIENLKESLKFAFSDPYFSIPGDTTEKQIKNLANAIESLNYGQRQALYENLGGTIGKGKKK